VRGREGEAAVVVDLGGDRPGCGTRWRQHQRIKEHSADAATTCWRWCRQRSSTERSRGSGEGDAEGKEEGAGGGEAGADGEENGASGGEGSTEVRAGVGWGRSPISYLLAAFQLMLG